jgi:hypothetical protein
VTFTSSLPVPSLGAMTLAVAAEQYTPFASAVTWKFFG